MTDVHTPEVRSYNMSRIRGKNTTPEVIVRKFLFSKGFRYRLYDSKLPGKPDIVLPKYHTIIFIHGCFWHGHKGCKYFVIPKTRTQWWLDKINRTKVLDERSRATLIDRKWNFVTVFECELNPDVRDRTMSKIIKFIKIGYTN